MLGPTDEVMTERCPIGTVDRPLVDVLHDHRFAVKPASLHSLPYDWSL